MKSGMTIGVMLLPVKEKYRQQAMDKLKELKDEFPNINLCYFNWNSKIDGLVDGDLECVAEEGAVTLSTPCYMHDFFDVVIDVPEPKPTLHEIKCNVQFKIFEDMCDYILSPTHVDVSPKNVTYDYIVNLLRLSRHKQTVDKDGRLQLILKKGFDPQVW